MLKLACSQVKTTGLIDVILPKLNVLLQKTALITVFFLHIALSLLNSVHPREWGRLSITQSVK